MFSRLEVAKHNTTEDCWIIIQTKVYDVTKYLTRHPGGDILFQHAGTDCTTHFVQAAHSTNAIKILNKFEIGKLNV